MKTILLALIDSCGCRVGHVSIGKWLFVHEVGKGVNDDRFLLLSRAGDLFFGNWFHTKTDHNSHTKVTEVRRQTVITVRVRKNAPFHKTEPGNKLSSISASNHHKDSQFSACFLLQLTKICQERFPVLADRLEFVSSH